MPQPVMPKKLKFSGSMRNYKTFQNIKKKKQKKTVLFIIGGWNVKLESQETLGVTGKFGHGVQNEEGERLTEFLPKRTHWS